MSAMVLDANKVNSLVMPNLTKTKTNLEEAYKLSNTLMNKLPSSASSRNRLSELRKRINTAGKNVNTIKTKLNSKVEKARSIESKSQSKTAGLAAIAAGAAAGIGTAALGRAVGKAAVGGALSSAAAAAAGIAGSAVGVSAGVAMAKTGAKVAAKAVSKTKSVLSKAFNFIKETGSKVVQSVKSGWNKFTTGVKKVVDKTKNVVKTAATKLKNTGAKIANSIKTIAKNVVSGVTSVVNKVKTGCKTIATKTKSLVQNQIAPALKNVGKKIVTGAKIVSQKYKELKCSIANTVVSLVEGIVSFGEALVDACTMLVGAVASIPTALIDIGSGLITKDWTFQNTKSLWKNGVMPVVGYDWTGSHFDKLYDTKLFKEIEENAWTAFKRNDENGIIYDIGKAVGYYTGLIALTTVTAGAGSAAGVLSSTTTVGNVALKTTTVIQAGFAATGSFGKNSQKNYNSELKSYVNNYYIEQQLQQNPNLSKDEAKKIVEENIKNGKYLDYNSIYEQAKENISYGKVIGKSYGQAAIDGSVMLLAGSVESVAKAYSGTSKIASKVLANKDNVSIGIKASKSYITEGFTTLIDKDGYDFKGATIDAVGTIVAEKASGAFKNAEKNIGKTDNNIVKKIYSGVSKIKYKGNPSEVNFDQNSKDIVKDLGKTLVAKGEERFVKEGAGAAYDVAIEMVKPVIQNIRT